MDETGIGSGTFCLTRVCCDIFTLHSLESLPNEKTRFNIMKQLKEKLKRRMKYLRVSYQQTSGRERLSLYMFVLVMLVYAWWVILVI